MPTDSTVAVIVSGVVAVAGVAVPAVTTFVSKRGDRAHDLALRREDRRATREERFLDERERLYLDWLRSSIRIMNAIHSALDEDTDYVDVPEPESDEQRHMGARVEAFASDDVRRLIQQWIEQMGDEPEGGPTEEWFAPLALVYAAAANQIREELRRGD